MKRGLELRGSHKFSTLSLTSSERQPGRTQEPTTELGIKVKLRPVKDGKEDSSMQISDQLQCLFSARIEENEESYYLEVPDQELQYGELRPDETYRVAVFPAPTSTSTDASETADEHAAPAETGHPEPPVEEGEHRTVEIEDMGDQGDGITRVERGFVVIVPDTEKGERVTVEIADVRENVAFAEVVKRLDYYE
ncbi:MAG: putative RNA-binding protein with TRAM domain [Halobacteriales archaeon]|jgi:predicted RNA-binding protein with TRAM domain